MQVLKAFHNDKKIKAKYLKRVRAHMKADELIRGVGFENGKGCAVGCTLDNYDHSKYPTELGIPEWLARVEDTLFEGMSLKKSKTWPEKFLKSIAVGAKLEKVKKQFLIVVLKHSLESLDAVKYDPFKNPEVKAAVMQSRAAITQTIQALNGKGSLRAAYYAANAAINAADAADTARDAAYYAASNAADAAGNAAYAAYAASNAANAAYDHYADELLKLLKKA